MQAREKQNQSWGLIAARAGVAEARVKRLYELTSGTPTQGLRLPKTPKPTPKATPKPARRVKASA